MKQSDEIAALEDGPDLMDIDAVCAFFGGTKPIDRATAWRWVKLKKIPRPVPELGRWLRPECVESKKAMIARRDTEAA
jgi:hypothetical protein